MKEDKLPTLIIDNNDSLYELYRIVLSNNGLDIIKFCTECKDALTFLMENKVIFVILNLNLADVSCMGLLKRIKDINYDIPVIIVSNTSNAEIAVEFMKNGAYDFIVNPDYNNLSLVVNNLKEIRSNQLKKHVLNDELKSDKIKNPDVFSKIITKNETMLSIFKYIEAIANSPKAVLITGESGTGKELIAKAIHELSRKEEKFVAVNVAGLDDTVFSDTLFGHKKGAFTGAAENRKGLIEHAEKGTLFLDEIGDLENSSQVKLLRLLQEEEYYPLGSDIPEKSTVRVITSTNADLEFKQEKGTFRADLYYRLNSHHINLPPLRDRLDDLPILIDFFLDESSRMLKKKKPVVSKKIFSLLRSYYFRGNIRELQSMIFDSVSRNDGNELDIAFFNEYIKKHGKEPVRGTSSYIGGDCNVTYSGRFPSLSEVEDFFITEALKKAKGNQTIAAQLLGVSQSTLSRHLSNKIKE